MSRVFFFFFHPRPGVCIPTILSLSLNPIMDVFLGLTLSLYLTYIHQPQFLSELLFLRSAQVLGYNFKHLHGHMECCISHKNYYHSKIKIRPRANCCLSHCSSLLRLFRTIEETFKSQLLIQFSLIMGTLIFGIYLSITFLISVNSTGSSGSHICFTLGFLLYSLIPAIRLLFVAHIVNDTLVQMNTAKHLLFEMEAVTATAGDYK